LSEEEVTRFLEAARADDRVCAERVAAAKTIGKGSKGAQWSQRARSQRVPQAALWQAFVETAARYGELTRIAWHDIDFERRVLVLRAENTKSGRERMIPLRDALVVELLALRAAHAGVLARVPSKHDRVFLTPEGRSWPAYTTNTMRIFDRLLEAAGIDRVDASGLKLDIHALRHSFASRLSRTNAGLVQAQRLLGHSDPKLTAQIYTHLDVEDLRSAIDGLGPRPKQAADESAA